MLCPICRGPMDQLERAGFVIDNCACCHGFWLDHGELEHMLSGRVAADASVDDVGPVLERLSRADGVDRDGPQLPCPRCSTVLSRVVFARGESAASAEKCPGCGGLWLNAGEMGMLFALVERGRRASPSNAPTKAKGRVLGSGELVGLLLLALLLGGLVAFLLTRWR